jgi:hypothetical protein
MLFLDSMGAQWIALPSNHSSKVGWCAVGSIAAHLLAAGKASSSMARCGTNAAAVTFVYPLQGVQTLSSVGLLGAFE